MSNQSELDPRTAQAIAAALEGKWQEAAALNSELAEEYPEDLDILNRLGHAYSELGQVNKASATFKKVLEIDPYNPIAKKNIQKLSTLRGADIKQQEVRTLDPEMFLEDPGKTKTIGSVDLAMPKVLITLRVGDTVELKIGKTEASVVSQDNKRLGKLESEWGKEIAQAATLGSSFSAIVKSIKVGKTAKDSSLSVFVRETKHAKKLVHPIFPIDTNFTPYIKEEAVSYIKEDSPVTPDSETDQVEEIPEQDDEEEVKEKLPQEAAELLPEPDLVEDEEEFKELR